MTRRDRVPVSMRALIQRINRKLAERGHRLKVTRERWRDTLGDCYTIDIKRNWIVEKHINPEKLGRGLGVLEEWEIVSD